MSTSPVADEAVRLVAALEEWLRGGGLSGSLAQGLHWADQHVGGAQECQLCPLCQLLALVRSTQPDVYEHLGAAAASLAAAARAAVANLARDPERPPVQHIDVVG